MEEKSKVINIFFSIMLFLSTVFSMLSWNNSCETLQKDSLLAFKLLVDIADIFCIEPDGVEAKA